ncbi:MAG TPA: hypothetical protein PK156_36010 [Polyangium sp.]|nr:hypothetical protein [Polyangium sp.]
MKAIIPAPPAFIDPARSFRAIIHNCDKDMPLLSGDPRFVDLSAGRGDQVTKMVVRDICDHQAGIFTHISLVSHRGAGKSTEIHQIEKKTADRFQPVYIEANVEMDPNEIEIEDLFLTIAVAVERELRRIEKPLPLALLERIETWFADAIKTTKWATGYNPQVAAGIAGKFEVPFLGSMFAQAKALLKYESEYRTEVKQVIKRYPQSLLDSVNELLDEANRLVAPKSLLVIFDNLDRYNPVTIDELLIVGADRVRMLRTHLLLTPPINLLLQPRSAQIDECYMCYDLFTVRLRKRGQRYDEFDVDSPGRDLLEQSLAKRIDLDLMIPEKSVRDRLIAASGGAIRELLDLVSMAARYTEGATMTEADVERAISRRKQRIRDQINFNGWWPTLREIAETKQPVDNEHCRTLLYQRLAFKYNGEGWYDVHPLIAELPEFSAGK